MNETITLATFIETHGLTMTVMPMAENPNMIGEMPGASHWMCVIMRSDAFSMMRVPFSQGAAYRRWKEGPAFGAALNTHDRKRFGYKVGDRVSQAFMSAPKTVWLDEVARDFTEPMPPDLANVLDCLASDCSSVENARDFADWCSDFGYDTDSIRAEKTYRACVDQSLALRRMLGGPAYDQLLNQVERL